MQKSAPPQSTLRIARRLGEAGGVVEAFVAVQEQPARTVVLKRLVQPWVHNAEFPQRYAAAVPQWANGLGLPELLEVGQANGVTYLVEALVEGETVRHVLSALAQRRTHVSPAEGVAVVARAARLLADLHGRSPSAVHGDVCPSTLLLTAAGEVYLLDVGVAAAAGATAALGPARSEVAALAPEQLTGPATQAADVFRLGLVLYELSLGRPLFAAADAAGVVAACQRYAGLVREQLKQVPEPFASLLVRMLSIAPAERPAPDEVAAVLHQASAAAGWKTPELDLSRLLARAYPERRDVGSALPPDGPLLTLSPLAGAREPERAPAPPEGAVLARIATRKVSRSELEASRPPPAVEVPRVAPNPEDADDGRGPRDARLGAALVEKRLLTAGQLDELLEQVTKYGGTLAEALESRGLVDEDAVVATLGEMTKTPVVASKKLREMQPQPEAQALVPLELARELDLVPLALKGGTQLVVAMRNPMDAAALERLRGATGLKSIVAMRGGERAIRKTRNRFYKGTEEDDVADWIERGAKSLSLLNSLVARGGSASGSGLPAVTEPKPAPGPAPEQRAMTSALLSVVDSLFGLGGDKGRQGAQLVAVAVLVAERLGASEESLQALKVGTSALVALNLAEGRPPWGVPTAERLSDMMGLAWPAIEPSVGPLFDFPAELPGEPASIALCAAVAFATHVGQAKPLPQLAARSLPSFKARFHFSPEAVGALAAVLGVPA